MSDKEMQVSEADLKGVKLKETQTKAQESEMKLVFQCGDKIIDWPSCCGESMELDEEAGQLVCTVEGCGKSVPIPEHEGQKCKPSIVKA